MEGVTYQNHIGTYRMRWCDVQKLQHGAGVLVLVGDNCRFVFMPPNYWSGPSKVDALAMLLQWIEVSGLPLEENRWAPSMWNRNVRTHQP